MLRGLPARTLPQRVVRAATRPLRVLRRRWVAGGAILTYHRVAEPGSSPFGLSVSPAHFEAHLAYLSTRCRVMPLLEMARRLACDDLPPRSVAVTFDDGYVDNLRNARPLLERYEVPGTVFVATGYIGGERAFWWDELATLMLEGAVPAELALPLGDGTRRWPTDTPPARRAAMWAVHGILRDLAPTARESTLDALRRWAGHAPRVDDASRAMTADELRVLVRDDLVDVGGHTVAHAALSALDADARAVEIAAPREVLGRLLARPIEAHAHPYGIDTDDAAELAVRAGYSAACAGGIGSVEAGDDPMRLPRFTVHDCDAGTFRRVVEHHLVD